MAGVAQHVAVRAEHIVGDRLQRVPHDHLDARHRVVAGTRDHRVGQRGDRGVGEWWTTSRRGMTGAYEASSVEQ